MFTVLMVEDNLTFRQSLGEILRARFPQLRVLEAGDGVAAFDLMQTQRVDLVLMDIRLPGENGLELTRKIKRRYQGLHVIIVTNHDLPEYREAAFRYGADHYVDKNSATCEEIAGLVQSVLAKPFVGDGPC